MKNLQKGFIVPVLLVFIALLVVGGGVYVFENKKTETPTIDTEIQPSNKQTNNQTQSVANQPNPTNNIKNPGSTSNIYIIKPAINETWQMGTAQAIQWRLNTDPSALRGSLFLTIFLQDSSGNLIHAPVGQLITLDQKSTTISIPYFNPAIVPGKYRLVLNIHDTIAALPCGGCQGYSKLVASATSSAEITLTVSDGKVKPAILSLGTTNGKVGDTISVNGVALHSDSKIIFERLNPLDGQARIKIFITPHVVSTTNLTFNIPSACNESDVCNPQNSSVTPGLYYVSVQTQYGTSNVSGVHVIN